MSKEEKRIFCFNSIKKAFIDIIVKNDDLRVDFNLYFPIIKSIEESTSNNETGLSDSYKNAILNRTKGNDRSPQNFIIPNVILPYIKSLDRKKLDYICKKTSEQTDNKSDTKTANKKFNTLTIEFALEKGQVKSTYRPYRTYYSKNSTANGGIEDHLTVDDARTIVREFNSRSQIGFNNVIIEKNGYKISQSSFFVNLFEYLINASKNDTYTYYALYFLTLLSFFPDDCDNKKSLRLKILLMNL